MPLDNEEQIKRIWDAFEREAEERRRAAAEFAKEMKELAAEREKHAAEREKRAVESDEEMAEIKKTLAETGRKLDSVSEKHGGYVNIAGLILEDEFFAALGDKKQVGGIVLDTVYQRLRHHYEYDLVGVNGNAVVVGEVKRSFRVEDVVKFTDKILPHFAEDFPQYARPKTFGMIAGENIMPEAEQEAKKRGLFILRLRNKSLVVGNVEQAKPIG